MEIHSLQVKFLNACSYFSGTLYESAVQFNIQHEPCYFPSKINLEKNYHYKGKIPDLNDFLVFSDTACEKIAKQSYVETNKNKFWVFYEELLKFSSHKVLLLAKVCLAFLEESFIFQQEIKTKLEITHDLLVHPFGDYLCSLSGFTYQLYRVYFLNNYDIFAIKNELSGGNRPMSIKEFEFVSYMTYKFPEKSFRHGLNHPDGQKSFQHVHVDLYSEKEKTVWEFFGCYHHYHDPNICKLKQSSGQTEKRRNMLKEKDEKYLKYLKVVAPDEIQNVFVVYECQWDYFKSHNVWIDGTLGDLRWDIFKNFSLYEERPLNRLVPRRAMRGGLIDTYALKWEACEQLNESFKYVDCNGLYSYVSMTNSFPVGKMKSLVGEDLLKIEFKNGKHYFNDLELIGAAYVLIMPPSNVLKPFLQFRVNETANYLTLCAECAKKNTITFCKHYSVKSRALCSVWQISDINLAVNENYHVVKWLEVHYYPDQEFILRDYVQLLDELKCSNETNQAKKAFYKNMANYLFGRFSQNTSQTKTAYITSQEELESLVNAEDKHVIDIRNGSEKCIEVEFETDSKTNVPNLRGNVYIGSQITSYARCFMKNVMNKLEAAGATIFFINVDGICYSIPKMAHDPLKMSKKCGDFKNVLGDLSNIQSFYALGNGNYSISFIDENGYLKTITKVKGLSLTSACIQNKVSIDTFQKFINHHYGEQFSRIAKLQQQKQYKWNKSNEKASDLSVCLPQLKSTLNKKTKVKQFHLSTFTLRNILFVKRFFYVVNDKLVTFPFGYKKKPLKRLF